MTDSTPTRGTQRFRSQGTDVESVFTTTDALRLFNSGSSEWTDWNYTDESYSLYLTSPYRYMSDVVGNRRGDNPLSAGYNTWKPAKFRCHVEVDVPEVTFPLPHFRYQRKVDFHGYCYGDHSLYPGDETISDVEFITNAASALNPSRPDFDAAVFLGELRDVPKLLSFVGGDLAKFGANEYLKFQYGWKPFVSDVKKLMKAVNVVDRKIKQLEKLRRDGIIRKVWKPKPQEGGREVRSFVREPDGNVDFPDFQWDSDFMQSRGVFSKVSTNMVTDRWAILTWSADSPSAPPITDEKLLLQARRAAFGGTVDGSTLWQLMPWSWLLDWTSNASEYLMSQRDVVDAHLSKTLLMKKTTRVSQISPIPVPFPNPAFGGADWYPEDGSATSVIKERFLNIMPEVEITGELSLLGESPFKLSILGALAVQRFRDGHR